MWEASVSRTDGSRGGGTMGNPLVSCREYRLEGAAMCDEYYDARMKAFWRALAEESELDEEKEEELVQPIVLQPIEPVKSKPKALGR